jgi:hypothetical protein
MTVNRTTLLNLPLPVTGTESGTWGDTTNNGLSQYMDIAIAGMTSLTSANFTAGALTLANTTGDSSATNIAASSAQYGAIKVSSLAVASTITAPSSNRRYVIINADATYNLTIKASGQTGVTVVPGEKALVAFNGTDYVKVGGAAGGSTTQIQFNNAGVFGGSANLTWDGTNVQIGATGALRLADTDSSNYVAFKSPGTVASNVTWTLPSADGTNGQALTTNGSGTLAFSTISTSAATPTTLGTVYGSMTTSGASPYLTALGYNAAPSASGAHNTAVGWSSAYSITSGDRNVAVGNYALNGLQTGVYNTAIGFAALYTNTGSSNTAVGKDALYLNTSGAANVGIGVSALYSNTTASGNTAVGYQTLYANQTGSDNVAVGYAALDANTTGIRNTAVGRDALGANTSGNDNVSVGANSSVTLTTGAQNTVVGKDALRDSTTANYNVAIGFQALLTNTTASNNTAVGYAALSANTTGAANTAIGSNALDACTTGNSNVALGKDAAGGLTTGNGNLMIGVECTTEATTGSNNTCVNALNGGNRLFALTTESNRVLVGYNGVTNAYVQVAWTVVSDARDKTDVIDAPYGLSFVQELKPIQYRWDRRSKYENGHPEGTHKEGKKQLGFLAQDVIALEKKYGGIEKDLLIGDDEHDETLKITETKMIPVLVKAIQELSAQVQALKAEIATLKGA